MCCLHLKAIYKVVADLLCHLVVHYETNFYQINSCSKNNQRIVTPVADHTALYRILIGHSI